MNDDWRVQILFRQERVLDQWHDLGHARELEQDLSDTFHDRVIVSRDDSVLFVYAADQAQAERARALVEKQARENGWTVESDLKHWDHEALEWEPPPAKALSEAEAESVSEPAPSLTPPTEPREDHEEPVPPRFELRVDLPSRHDAIQLADRLRAEATPCIRRWRHLIVAATDEEAAQELTDQIRMETPIGTQVTVQGASS